MTSKLLKRFINEIANQHVPRPMKKKMVDRVISARRIVLPFRKMLPVEADLAANGIAIEKGYAVISRHDAKDRFVRLPKFLQKLEDMVDKNDVDNIKKILPSVDVNEEFKARILQSADAIRETQGATDILITSEPIDVIRMSDFKHIQSCHSQDGCYFDQAKIEARAGGLIAYLLTEKPRNVTQAEVLQDLERDVPGVVPVARLKVRMMREKDGLRRYVLAADDSVYGHDVPGFYECVRDWARNINAETLGPSPELGTLIMLGGSYTDSDLDTLVANNVVGIKRRPSVKTMQDLILSKSLAKFLPPLDAAIAKFNASARLKDAELVRYDNIITLEIVAYINLPEDIKERVTSEFKSAAKAFYDDSHLEFNDSGPSVRLLFYKSSIQQNWSLVDFKQKCLAFMDACDSIISIVNSARGMHWEGLRRFIALILESERSDAFRNNLKTMARLAGGEGRYVAERPYDDTLWSDYFTDPSLDKKLFRDIARCPQLYTNKVIRLCGAGSEGIAFELDDGTVLKLGQMHTGVKPDGYHLVSVPWKYRDRGDLKVHDTGRAHVNTEKLVPFSKWVNQYKKSDSKAFRMLCSTLMDYITDARRSGQQFNVKRYYESEFNINPKLRPIADRIAAAYARAAHGRSIDLSLYNLGYRPSDGKFVFYDF